MTFEGLVKSNRQYSPIGKYDIVEHIATGGMGSVYRAIDRETGHQVALKVLAPTLAVNANSVERFRREAAHGNRLHHDNIVGIYECGEANGMHFLALEYVHGIDLQEYIDGKGKLDPEEARGLLIQAVRALDYLHRQQLVHRDIKPSNFLLTEIDDEIVLKLTDLGLVRTFCDDEFRVTRDGHTVGTIDYMAPEQARDSSLADIRSDIYSLGCTFYQMLAGRSPFAEGGLADRLLKHLEAEPPDIRLFNRDVPQDLVRVLERMLAKKPAERYQTPADLLLNLTHEETADQEPSLPAPDRLEDPVAFEPPARASSPQVTVAFEPSARASSPQVTVQEVVADTVTKEEDDALDSTTADQRHAAAGQFTRANQVIASGNREYGIHLLLSCCKLDPANLSYRQTLRRLENSPGGRVRRWSPRFWLGTFIVQIKLRQAKKAGHYLKVLELGEDLLLRRVSDLGAQRAIADAAEALGLLRLATWTLEWLHRRHHANAAVNHALARLYEKKGQFKQAIGLLEKVIKINPADQVAHDKIKDLAVQETVAQGQYAQRIRARQSAAKN